MISKLKDYLLILPLILFGLYIRLIGVIVGNFGFTFDQGRDMLEAFAITHGKLTLIGPTTGLSGLNHGPLWYYIVAIFSFVGGGDPRFVIAGIIFLFLIVELFLFWTIKKYYGLFAGLVFFGLVTLSPALVAQSGQFWSPNMTVLSMMVAAIALIGIFHEKKIYWILLGLALGANVQFEIAGGVFLFISITLTLILASPHKTKFSDYGKYFGALLLTLIPQLLFEARHGFQITKVALSYAGNTRQDFIAAYGQKTIEYKTGLFFDNFNRLLSPNNVVFSLIFIAIVFGLFAKLLAGRKTGVMPETKIPLIWNLSIVIFMWIIVNLYKDVVWHHFLTGLFVISAITITLIFYNLKNAFPKITYLIASAVFIYILIPNLNASYKAQKNIIGNHSYYKNQVSIVDRVYQDSSGQPFNVVVYNPTTFAYPYDYLFSWYGERKYGRTPVDNSSRQSLAYFIIDPDDIAGRQAKWINDRQGDGDIIWSQYYWNSRPGANDGLILQKRIRLPQESKPPELKN